MSSSQSQRKFSSPRFFDHRLESRSKFQGRRAAGKQAETPARLSLFLCADEAVANLAEGSCRDLIDSSRNQDGLSSWAGDTENKREETAAPAATEAYLKRNA